MASTSFESFSQLINNSPSLVWHETFLPLNILTTLHAIYITLNYKNSLKHSKVPWLQGFFAVIVMSVGGSTSSGKQVFTNLIYTLMFYFQPFYRLSNLIPNNIINPILLIADGILRGYSICLLGIDSIRYDSRNKDPDLSNSLVAMILCGILCGSGGSIWTSAFKLGSPFWSFTTPSVLLQPSYDMKSSFLLSLFYISTTTTSTLTIDQGRTFSILLAIAFNLVKLKELNESSSLRKLEDIEKEDIKMEDIKMENIKKKD
ncbi:19899_t:CDS:2 [Entrophospora sp. SA101]|nr:19899_t:CDS:2 [Entrophospora sp. SA101]